MATAFGTMFGACEGTERYIYIYKDRERFEEIEKHCEKISCFHFLLHSGSELIVCLQLFWYVRFCSVWHDVASHGWCFCVGFA